MYAIPRSSGASPAPPPECFVSPRTNAGRRLRAIAFVALMLLAAACSSDDNGNPMSPKHAEITSFSVAANDNNVLSAIVAVTATNTDSAHVVYWTGSDAKQSTPFVTDLSGGHLPVLGLQPESEYNFYVEAFGGGVTATSDTATLTTGALPTFLQSVSLSSASPASFGYIFTALLDGSTSYVTGFDSTGRVAWYREFPDGPPAEEVKQQANGDFTAVLTTSHGAEAVPGHAVEIAPDGSIVRTFTAPDTAFMDGHEFWLLFNDGAYDGALMLQYTARHLDLSGTGGPSDSLVVGHQLVREDANGNQTVVFNAWDHFHLSDNVEPTMGQLDFDHPNAISIAGDGNYVVSWRNLDLITKIDATTGALIWTFASPFAATDGDFTMSGDALGGFSAQHSVRVLPNDNILVFDNGTKHAPSKTRAVEYQLDTGAHTATMTFQFLHAPAIYTPFTGSVQRLASGNTLIGYPFGAPPFLATEVTPTGSVVYEGTLHASGTQAPYRFTKVRSLYRYEAP